MSTPSITKQILGSSFVEDGVIAHPNGQLSRAIVMNPLPSGALEESFDGASSDQFFVRLTDLLGKLPNLCSLQFLLLRGRSDDSSFGYRTKLFAFEQIPKNQSYSHLQALLGEMGLNPSLIIGTEWQELLSGFFGAAALDARLPDLIWEPAGLKLGDEYVRTVSLTELPQVTWKGCFQSIFEIPAPFSLSIRIETPDRTRIRRQLETKRRVSHALSISSSLEVRNIESNSVLHSSEETLERILVGKETLFELSLAVILRGSEESTTKLAQEIERMGAGIGNAGFFTEGLGALPVFQSHIPGNKTLGIRKLPILSENLAHLLPVLHDYSRQNDPTALPICSRSSEISHLNLFSKENLNFNSFICGASGSGKSFLMNAILCSSLKDEPSTRLCIFDVGGSYRRIVESQGGKSTTLTRDEARALMATYFRVNPVRAGGFFRAVLETLCGSGPHLTHSHLVALEELLKQLEGSSLSIQALASRASEREERYYQDIAHWLRPHADLDEIEPRTDLLELIRSSVSAFDFKSLDSDPVLQRSTLLLLSEMIWQDLVDGRHTRTLIVFDEVWRFFAQSKGFLEEMYRTLRKYRAGIVSITQNLADYGDEAFSKMIFTNSFTKLFLQNGASADFLRNTFDLPQSEIARALSVHSKKPEYSEFFALTPAMSQVFRLYPTPEFYALANTENISQP
jgi:type IV secretory pathway VirB4 component